MANKKTAEKILENTKWEAGRRERIEKNVERLQSMRRIMLEDENWESMKGFIEATTYGGMALQRMEKFDEVFDREKKIECILKKNESGFQKLAWIRELFGEEPAEADEIPKELRESIMETAENICDNFCKFGGTGNENGCAWCQTHEGDCPLDKILKEVER